MGHNKQAKMIEIVEFNRVYKNNNFWLYYNFMLYCS